eukprot:Seg9010.2 transcript_id=Seg9010.2/GoldUCD/mRNA.D3Y31 product="Thymidine phosphorylase" protein_id=Seg9010.2/GoldUCD/D3Y31
MASNSIRYPDLIALKRDGGSLTKDQINHFIDGVVNGHIHGSQIGAMLMAIFLKGMNHEETIGLTHSMMNSGEKLSWPDEWNDLVVDKHSSGGVGDKISLPLAPALAACGMKVPMISGRSLGFTGGTLDKLESIPGFRTNFTSAEIKKMIDNVGCCIVGQTQSLVPADKVLYSIRDITGTVACIPLVASSIVSKKAAESLRALVLDVKCGMGCFNKTREVADTLANAMVTVSAGLGIKTTAFITEMDNPIGKAVGNSVEVAESLDCLNGKGPEDLLELVCKQGGELLFLANKASSSEEGHDKILSTLTDGSAMLKFKQMMQAQGVEEGIAEKLCNGKGNYYDILPLSIHKTEISAQATGVLTAIDALCCAEVTAALGAGRTKPGEPVLHNVGLYFHCRVGDVVKAGVSLVTVYHKNEKLEKGFEDRLKNVFTIDSSVQKAKEIQSRVLHVVKSN